MTSAGGGRRTGGFLSRRWVAGQTFIGLNLVGQGLLQVFTGAHRYNTVFGVIAVVGGLAIGAIAIREWRRREAHHRAG